MEHEIEREFLGKPVVLRATYTYNPAIGGNKTDKPEREFVEIASVMTKHFCPPWMAKPEWIEVPCSDEELEIIADEILEGLL